MKHVTSKVAAIEGRLVYLGKQYHHRDVFSRQVNLAYDIKETRGFSVVGADRASFNERSRKNKCSDGMPELVGSVCTLVGFIYHEGR